MFMSKDAVFLSIAAIMFGALRYRQQIVRFASSIFR